MLEEKQGEILDMREFITKNLMKDLLKHIFGKKDIEPRRKECDEKKAGKRKVHVKINLYTDCIK